MPILNLFSCATAILLVASVLLWRMKPTSWWNQHVTFSLTNKHKEIFQSVKLIGFMLGCRIFEEAIDLWMQIFLNRTFIRNYGYFDWAWRFMEFHLICLIPTNNKICQSIYLFIIASKQQNKTKWHRTKHLTLYTIN